MAGEFLDSRDVGSCLRQIGDRGVPDMGRANYLFFFKPVIAAGLAFVILRQEITAIQILAIAAITLCVSVEVFYGRIYTKSR